MLHTFVAHVQDKPGVLTRVASLFRRLNINIVSLTVGESERTDVSRMTIVCEAPDHAAHPDASPTPRALPTPPTPTIPPSPKKPTPEKSSPPSSPTSTDPNNPRSERTSHQTE